MDCVFIGYTRPGGAFRFLVHNSKNPGICNDTIIESKDASWFEHVFPCLGKGEPSEGEPSVSKLVEEIVLEDEVANNEPREQSEI